MDGRGELAYRVVPRTAPPPLKTAITDDRKS